MKITLEKGAILLSEMTDAKAMAKDYAWIEKTDIRRAASNVISKYYGAEVYCDLVDAGKITIAKNNFLLCLYAFDVAVSYYAHGGNYQALLCFEVIPALDGPTDSIHAFVRIYKEIDLRCI